MRQDQYFTRETAKELQQRRAQRQRSRYNHYFSGDLTSLFEVADEYDLEIYLEYIPKSEVLKAYYATILEVHPEESYVLIYDLYDKSPKRFNYNRIYRVGIEGVNEDAPGAD